jgi:hypothetical protein
MKTKPLKLRRSDVFFIAALLVYAVGLLLYISDLKNPQYNMLLLVWIVVLTAGALIKNIKNPLQNWFNEEVTFFKPKNLALPDGAFASKVYEFENIAMFPVIGQTGHLYLDKQNNHLYVYTGLEYNRTQADFG